MELLWVEYISRNYTNFGIILFSIEITVKCEVIYVVEREKYEIGFCVSSRGVSRTTIWSLCIPISVNGRIPHFSAHKVGDSEMSRRCFLYKNFR